MTTTEHRKTMGVQDSTTATPPAVAPVGTGQRPEDNANQLRAPDFKPLDSYYAEDLTQFGAAPQQAPKDGVEEGVIVPDVPDDTHAQKPGQLVSPEPSPIVPDPEPPLPGKPPEPPLGGSTRSGNSGSTKKD